jgi:hypothetical protein
VRAPVAALFVVLVASGRAEAAPSTVAVVVDVAPSTGDGWFAAALEQTIARELSRFHSVTLGDKLNARACPGREARCLVDRYRDAGVDIVVLGRLRQELLDYDVYATWTRGRAFDGSLATLHVDAATLRRHIGELARPIVQRGGLVDERPARAAPAPADAATATARHPLLLATLLFALMLLVALPPLWARLLVGARELARRGRPASWMWSGALIAALGLVAVAAMTTDLPARVVAAVAGAGATGELAAAVAAGMIWGAFALVHASWVLAPIHGLGQARHDAIWPLLQSWLNLAFLRACLLVAYVPLFWLALAACDALGLPRRATFMLALPTVGLFIHFWLLTLVDNVAAYLDVHLVVGSATARNPWHATIKRYFRGYIRRNGVDVDAALFERTLFLPSALPGVVSYGGGFARPRILVGEQVRDAALGQLPDETELPERTVNPEELPFGFVLPAPAPTIVGRRRARDATLHDRQAEQRRHELTVAPARPRAAAPRVLGESPTLLGWVMPQPTSDGVPLIANSNEELEVVRQLLTEHYAAFERNVDDDEIDDTDPTQKDFLFAALLVELGRLRSRDTFLTTLRLALALVGPKASRLRRWLVAATVGVYDRFLSGPAARVADAEAALNQGLHQLIQYLAFLRGGGEQWLTTRANAPKLIQTSKELLEHMDRAAIPTVERQLLAATPRNRLLWLSQLFHAPLARRADRALGTAAALLLATVAGGALYIAVRDAVDYHPTYVERMRSSAPAQGAASDE